MNARTKRITAMAITQNRTVSFQPCLPFGCPLRAASRAARRCLRAASRLCFFGFSVFGTDFWGWGCGARTASPEDVPLVALPAPPRPARAAGLLYVELVAVEAGQVPLLALAGVIIVNEGHPAGFGSDAADEVATEEAQQRLVREVAGVDEPAPERPVHVH